MSWCFDKVRECTKSATIEERLWEIAVLKMSAHAIFKVQHQHGNNLWKKSEISIEMSSSATSPKNIENCISKILTKKSTMVCVYGEPSYGQGKAGRGRYMVGLFLLIFLVFINFTFFYHFCLGEFCIFLQTNKMGRR